MCKDFKLSNLLDPMWGHNPIDIKGFDLTFLDKALRSMLLIRNVEIRLAKGRESGLIKGPVHLGVGQEAIAVGVSSSLSSSDRVFGAHRSHSHILALGSDVRKLFAEVLGRSTGHSRGMGGSMHLLDLRNGFFGSVPIVAGTVSLAVGAAMASRLKKTSDVSVVYLGDGACEEGVFHESLNLASIQKDPVLFVVENNMFASHMHWSLRQPEASTARFAEANRVPFRVVDGNNVTDVAMAAEELITNSRNKCGPGFLEAFTYRWYGHVDWREDIDVGVSRSREDVDQWKAKDPIKRLFEGMVNSKLINKDYFEELKFKIKGEVDEAWDLALNDPIPDTREIISTVYQNEQG